MTKTNLLKLLNGNLTIFAKLAENVFFLLFEMTT